MGDLSRRQKVALAVLASVAALLFWLARGTKEPPFLPEDRNHAAFVSADRCLACHGTAGPYPQSRNHPPRRDCMHCHAHRSAP